LATTTGERFVSGPPPDEWFMQACLREAAAAEQAGEVPVGAVVVRAGQIVGRGRNASIGTSDPSAHAEIVALRAAGAALGNYRLVDAELFVTVEPCLMCVGAIMHARLRRVVYGCADRKAGALGGLVDFSRHPGLNHSVVVRAGVCEAEARELLQRFFRARRAPE
jgi:tRNA(adenine34) deaminase